MMIIEISVRTKTVPIDWKRCLYNTETELEIIDEGLGNPCSWMKNGKRVNNVFEDYETIKRMVLND